MSELLVWITQTVWIALSELLAPSRSLRVEGWKLYQMKAYDALVAVVRSDLSNLKKVSESLWLSLLSESLPCRPSK